MKKQKVGYGEELGEAKQAHKQTAASLPVACYALNWLARSLAGPSTPDHIALDSLLACSR